MAGILGTVKDKKDILIPNVPVILTGGGIAPQIFQTGLDGKFQFPNLSVGNYKVSSVYENYFFEELAEIAAGQNTDTNLDIKLSRKFPQKSNWEYIIENKYVLLKYGQYLFLGLIGWFFFDRLIGERIPDLSLKKLNEIESARGAITYLVAVTTISMAAILMLSAIMTGGKDLDKRFALGKEILTLLIGILGTIIGFYYGSSNKSGSENSSTSIQIDSLTVIQQGREVILAGKITGGKPPFVYSVLTDPKGKVNNINNRIIKNGDIRDTLNLFDSIKTNFPMKFRISVRDTDDIIFNQDLELPIVK